MTRRRLFVLILLMIGFLLLMISCSVDPMVASCKLYILGVGQDEGRVLYNKDYESRVIFLDVNKTCVLKAVSNRLNDSKYYNWSSNTENVVTITKLQNEDVCVKANIYGVSRIEVNNNKTNAYCYVIVNDKSDSIGLQISISGVSGLIESNISNFSLSASSISELNNKEMILTYSCDDMSKVKKVEWYLDGVLYSTDKDLNIAFSSFGEYNIDCILYGKNNYGVIEPLSSCSVNIECKFN